MNKEKIVKAEFEEWEAKEAKEIDFGGRVAELLRDREMSQRDLAKAVKVTEVTMSRYISNQRSPKAPVIVAIAKALGVSCDYLLGYERKPEGELLSCPFCGADAIPQSIYPTPFTKMMLTVTCVNCGAMIVDTNANHCLNDVIRMWNKRVI